MCEECGREDGHYLGCESAPKPATVKAPTRRQKKEIEDE